LAQVGKLVQNEPETEALKTSETPVPTVLLTPPSTPTCINSYETQQVPTAKPTASSPQAVSRWKQVAAYVEKEFVEKDQKPLWTFLIKSVQKGKVTGALYVFVIFCHSRDSALPGTLVGNLTREVAL
jgi:hypothetical protein